ncbi:hypothetical protein F5888DRAFT_1910741 [Russula emetica]|nr:hypothetical protein F5888DRAFT_1910741 [Russula emetica]
MEIYDQTTRTTKTRERRWELLVAEGKVPMWVMQNGNVMDSLWTGSDENRAPLACHGRLQQSVQLAIVRGGRLPTEAELHLLYDKFDSGYEGGRNVGFRNWHPVPATTGGEGGGRGHNGDVWGWTSTEFDGYEGFVPLSLYPGFSADFFDTLHNVAIGRSNVTTPCQAERGTSRNFFQRNYPYSWIGGRIAYDVAK